MILSAKQGGIKYHFLSLWYDLIWDWTPVSRIIGEHSSHLADRWDPKNTTTLAIKEYSTFSRYLELEPYDQMQLTVFQGKPIFGQVLPLHRRCDQRILSQIKKRDIGF